MFDGPEPKLSIVNRPGDILRTAGPLLDVGAPGAGRTAPSRPTTS